jgi:hypothetical protein
MNKLTKAVLLSAAVALANQAARAQLSPGDLILGFSPAATASSGNDYVIDLGQVPTGNQVTHLGSLVDFTTFNSTFTTANQLAQVGIIDGFGINGTTGDYDIISVARVESGNPGAAGTETPPAKPSTGSRVTQAATAMSVITPGTPSITSSTSSFFQSTKVNGATFANNLQVDPRVSFSSTVALDLYKTLRSGAASLAYAYVGQLDIDLSSFSMTTPATVDFIPAGFVSAVPEPATFGVIAGAGLLLLSLRRQFRNQIV